MSFDERHILQVCPFCGHWRAMLGGDAYEGDVWTQIDCYFCDAHGPIINGYNETMAAEAWNVRGGSPELLSPEKRGYKKSDSIVPEALGHVSCPFCASRKIEADDTGYVCCDNCGAVGPAYISRDHEDDEKDPASRLKAGWDYWDERRAPIGVSGERAWTHSYASSTIEGTLEGIEEKNGLRFVRIREGGQPVHLLLGDLPCDEEFVKKFTGFEVRFRVLLEPLAKPENV